MKILLIVGAVATGISLLLEALTLAFPLTDDQEFGENPMGAALVLTVALLAILELFLYLATVVFFCVWLYRAYANLRALNPARRLEYFLICSRQLFHSVRQFGYALSCCKRGMAKEWATG